MHLYYLYLSPLAARPASSSAAAAAANAKDDSALGQRRLQQQRSRRSASQAAVNRLSLGDFATTFATPAPKSLPPNSINLDPVHGAFKKCGRVSTFVELTSCSFQAFL